MSSSAKTVAELIEEGRRNPLRWLIPDILLEDGVHVLHAQEESFKTMLTIQLQEVLTFGGYFLGRKVEGGLRTGIAQLETKPSMFAHRLENFFNNRRVPDIHVLPADKRQEALAAKTPMGRIKIIADWAEDEGLQFVSIDSVAKLSPVGWDSSRQDVASEIFNQIQRLPTPWIIAHDRKLMPGISARQNIGNQEIVGSGRFAQDPDVVHQMFRPDRRSPLVEFHWGKSREGDKCEPLSLYFDKVDVRLHPVHPYLHLLGDTPVCESSLLMEAERRFGWQDRAGRKHLATLQKLRYQDGSAVIEAGMIGHKKAFFVTKPIEFDSISRGSDIDP